MASAKSSKKRESWPTSKFDQQLGLRAHADHLKRDRRYDHKRTKSVPVRITRGGFR
jgi:hypothetical protein